MELWDAYTKEGVLTGGTLVRGEPIPEGLYHLVCEVLVRHRDGSYLCMVRSREKPNFPGYYEATSGGSALKGEDPLACIRREVREETGLSCETFTELARHVFDDDHCIFYTYLANVDCPKGSVQLQAGETEGYRWMNEGEFIDFVNSGDMIPTQKRRFLNWYEKMGYIRTLAAECGTREDINLWMELVKRVSWNFPGLETPESIEEHRQTVLRFMSEKRALCVKDEGQIAGVLLYSRKHNMICCLAVSPEHRRRGIASVLLDKALKKLDRGKDITVTTFRAEDEKGTAPRALYQRFGFKEGRMLVEFGYPVQEFVLAAIGGERI